MTKVWKDDARRSEFFSRLEQLIGEYPELVGPEDPDDIVDEVLDGYDPASPKLLNGIVLLLAFHNLDNWSEILVQDPIEQSHYLTIGMLTNGLHLQQQS